VITHPADMQDHIFRALPRFIGAGHTWDTEDAADIWSHARSISTEPEGLERVCLWMRVFTISGVEVPWEMMSHIIGTIGSGSHTLEAIIDLIHAIGNNTASIPAESYAELCCEVFGQFCLALDLNDHGTLELRRESVPTALRLLLKAYGVSQDDLYSSPLGLGATKIQGSLKYVHHLENQLTTSESKRKRLTLALRQFDLSAQTVLQAAGLLKTPDLSSGQVLEFLWLLSTKATLAANVDSFVCLCHCVTTFS
jgi:hypothetical protein